MPTEPDALPHSRPASAAPPAPTARPAPAARPAVPPALPRIVHGRPGPGNRPPLPPGHPDTWGRITAGTCIDGAPYPHPIFDGRGGRPRW